MSIPSDFQRHFEDPCANTAQDVDHAVIRGALDDDRRSARHQQPDHKLDRLLGARSHDHVFRHRRQPMLGDVVHDRTAETDAAVRRVVGEIGREPVRKPPTAGRDLEFPGAVGVRRRIVGGKTDDAGSMRELIEALGQ